MNPAELPARFRQTMRELYGPEGEAWLQNLPALRQEYARRWSLSPGPTLPGLSYNYVALAETAGGLPAILKLGVPNSELSSEIAALRHYGGRGAARLLEADAEGGALLLERLQPGTMLVDLEDDERATTLAAGVMRRLWTPPPDQHAFPSVSDWARGLEQLRRQFEGGTGPFPTRLVEMAEALYAELLPSQAAAVLLHGDLHHYNILLHHRAHDEPPEWLAIDPKGVVGEPAYEAGALLRNPVPQVAGWADLKQVQARRLDILAEHLDLDRQRLLGWAVAQVVLSGWWSYEDHGEESVKSALDRWLVIGESLAALL